MERASVNSPVSLNKILNHGSGRLMQWDITFVSFSPTLEVSCWHRLPIEPHFVAIGRSWFSWKRFLV